MILSLLVEISVASAATCLRREAHFSIPRCAIQAKGSLGLQDLRRVLAVGIHQVKRTSVVTGIEMLEAIFLPSGDQAHCVFCAPSLVNCFLFLPSISQTKISAAFSVHSAKTSFLPFGRPGKKRGRQSSVDPRTKHHC